MSPEAEQALAVLADAAARASERRAASDVMRQALMQKARRAWDADAFERFEACWTMAAVELRHLNRALLPGDVARIRALLEASHE